MQHSYLLSVISFGKLISMISRNKGISLKFLGRFLFLLQGSIWASIFKRVEKLKISREKLIIDHRNGPVFIIGHWRTGSTFLHQLMSLDNNFSTPTVVKVSVPDSFLVSEKYFRKLMSKVISDTRPMDNVKLGPDEPQEDEYAIVKMVKDSALERIFFRRKKSDFLHELRLFMEEEKLSDKWKKEFKTFAAKLVFDNNTSALFKNPFHSYRITELKKLFPNAKFIHIYRNPVSVIPSTVKMWNIVGPQNLLAGNWQDVSFDNAILFFNSLRNKIKQDQISLNNEDFAEVRFESLENDPVASMKKLYADLGLQFSTNFESLLTEFTQSISTYKKNKYDLAPNYVEQIKQGCKEFIKEYNYEV